MLQHYHREYNRFCSELTNSESESYTNPDQICSSQTGSPDRTKEAEIAGMQLIIDAIQTTTNIPDCITIQQLHQATLQDNHLQQLEKYIIRGWPENKDQIPQDMHTGHFVITWQ